MNDRVLVDVVFAGKTWLLLRKLEIQPSLTKAN